MDQIGYVVYSDNDTAVLDVRRVTACGDKCGTCGSGCNVPATRIKVKNVLGVKLGDFVEVRMKTSAVLKSAFIAYIIPLVMLLIGILLGMNISKGLGMSSYESIGFLTGLIFLAISFIILRYMDNKMKKDKNIEMELVRILDNDN